MTAIVFSVLAVAFGIHTSAMWATNGGTRYGSSKMHRAARWILFYAFTAAAVIFAVLDRVA